MSFNSLDDFVKFADEHKAKVSDVVMKYHSIVLELNKRIDYKNDIVKLYAEAERRTKVYYEVYKNGTKG